jgi:hypothetical protein
MFPDKAVLRYQYPDEPRFQHRNRTVPSVFIIRVFAPPVTGARRHEIRRYYPPEGERGEYLDKKGDKMPVNERERSKEQPTNAFRPICR